ncbi:MAG TPA: polysaccharide biosynthesis C-terminal domain-containing protein [Ktedonobacteraceae bacterium]|nr:polysaccharide biosynthesis C-terminal domain-containing protein [Ktedonobacteraceae bacterium]
MDVLRLQGPPGREERTESHLHPQLWQRGIVLCCVGITAIVYVLIAQALGPQAFGRYLFVQWLATVALPMLGVGVSTLTSNQLATIQSRESPRRMAGIFYFLWYRQHQSILLYCLLYLLLAFPLARLFHIFSVSLLLLSGLATLPLLLSSVVGTTLRSLRRADLLTMLHLFNELLTLLFVTVALQVEGRPLEAFLLAFALAHTLTLILAVICVIHLLPLEKALQPGIFLKERLQQSLTHAWLPFTLDTIIWHRSELFLLACWRSSAELGFYALSALISMAIMNVSPALYFYGIYPLFQRTLPRYRTAYDAFIKISCCILFLAILCSSLAVVFSPTLVTQWLGSAYLPLIRPLRILLVAAVFGSMASVSLTHMTSGEEQHVRRWPEFVVACVKIILAIPLIAFWGIVGAAVVSACAQIASALLSMMQCRQLLKRRESSCGGEGI